MPVWTCVDRLILAAATGSLLFCTAVNCYTYRIAYPLWQWIGRDEFPAVHREYMRRLGPVITLPHVLALFSSAALVLRRPPWLNAVTAGAVFGSCALVIALSWFVAGPVHSRLDREGRVTAEDLSRLHWISAVRSLMLLLTSALLLLQIANAL